MALGLAGSYNYFGTTSMLPLTVIDWSLVSTAASAVAHLGRHSVDSRFIMGSAFVYGFITIRYAAR